MLQVKAVEFLEGNQVKDELVQPPQSTEPPHSLARDLNVNAIRIHFNKNLDASSITTGDFDPTTGNFDPDISCLRMR